MKSRNQSTNTIPKLKTFDNDTFNKRISDCYEELYRHYNSIYHNDEMFESLIDMIYDYYKTRSDQLKNLDIERLKNPRWYCQNDSIGIQIYTEKFAGTLRGIESKLDYLQNLGVKFIYALPFLRSPEGKSDGGFAVSDYRNVREDLGTIDDLQHLIDSLHSRGMCFCMDFVINHTSDEHEWAKRAKQGEIDYQNRYYFYDSWYVPNQFDSYGVMGHFFGDIAPDNFTYVPECKKIVMTTFYPYQWDLNFRNPVVFSEMLSNILFLMNLGVDVVFFNGTSNLWKKAGTSCRNLPQAYVINYLIYMAMQIVCPASAAYFDIKRHKSPSNLPINLQDDENENDESESENEKEFIITESGVITTDNVADLEIMTKLNKHEQKQNEEEEEIIDFDLSTEIGQIHRNFGWMSRLWASMAFSSTRSISFSVDAMCRRYKGDCYYNRVHSHDDINWGLGFGVEQNSLIGNGLGTSDGFQGGIISVYRYLNDFYTGNMPGSFSKGITFAEDLVTGKARICGTTASLSGLETALKEKERLLKHKKNSDEKYRMKLKRAENKIQDAINRILLLHAVSVSMPFLFFLYCGDEIGNLNDYSYRNIPEIANDTRYIQRGKFDWNSTKFINDDENSYQSRIFNGIQRLTKARIGYPSFTENRKTVLLKSFAPDLYDDENPHKLQEDQTLLIFKRFTSESNFLLFVFNFCRYQRPVNIPEVKGKFKDLISGDVFELNNDFKINAYCYLWLEPLSK